MAEPRHMTHESPPNSQRRALPSRREHRTQKVRIAGRRTLYIAVHKDPYPAELFCRVKGAGCTTEVIALYDVLARLSSLALQYGAPLEKVADMLTGVKFEPAGPVTGHPHIRFCSSLPDLIGRHLLIEYCDRADLASGTEGASPPESRAAGTSDATAQ